MTVATRRIYLSEPMPHQIPVLLDPSRFKVVKCGRRWGKTEGVGDVATLVGHGPFSLDAGNPVPQYRGALYGGNIWRILPTLPQAGEMWDRMCDLLAPVWLRKTESPEHKIWLPGGGTFSVRSAERLDTLRGPGLTGAVLDEIKQMGKPVWDALRPALMDKQGWALGMGTPSDIEDPTRLDVWMWQFAETEPGWARWCAPSDQNPLNTPREMAAMRRELGEAAFRRECLVEYASDGATLFRREWLRFYEQAPPFVFRFATVDSAATEKSRSDWTVIAVWGITADGNLYLIEVVRARLDGARILEALKSATQRHDLDRVYLEVNAYSAHIVSIAKGEGVPVESVRADRSKKVRAEPAAAAMERGNVWAPKSAPWLATWQDEVFRFTGDEAAREVDDQVDTLSYAVLVLDQRTRRVMRPPKRPRLSGDGGWVIGRG